jgi:hypothetical protein
MSPLPTRRAAGAALAAALLALAAPARAQSPDPAELPWNAAPAAVRVNLERLGFRAAPAASGDSVFVADRGGARAELRARFREGVMYHAFYSVVGDSATVQGELNRTAAALTARHGQPSTEGDSRVWTLDGGRRYALPAAPLKLESGAFGYAVASEAP